MSGITIGKVARQVGIGIETIRFYERKGLIDEPPRRESGYRQYQEKDISRLKFIQKAKTLGFSLSEIGDLLSLCEQPGTTSRKIKQLAEAKLIDIESKIKMLSSMQRSLKGLVEKCPGKGPTSECPILESLNSGNF